jgi:hypothetical protein
VTRWSGIDTYGKGKIKRNEGERSDCNAMALGHNVKLATGEGVKFGNDCSKINFL